MQTIETRTAQLKPLAALAGRLDLLVAHLPKPDAPAGGDAMELPGPEVTSISKRIYAYDPTSACLHYHLCGMVKTLANSSGVLGTHLVHTYNVYNFLFLSAVLVRTQTSMEHCTLSCMRVSCTAQS